MILAPLRKPGPRGLADRGVYYDHEMGAFLAHFKESSEAGTQGQDKSGELKRKLCHRKYRQARPRRSLQLAGLLPGKR